MKTVRQNKRTLGRHPNPGLSKNEEEVLTTLHRLNGKDSNFLLNAQFCEASAYPSWRNVWARMHHYEWKFYTLRAEPLNDTSTSLLG